MEQNSLFSEIYAIDPATDLYMIEIALDRYADVFNEWDPAPFKRRSLDDDLELYLEGSSEEIPLRYAIELCFTIPPGIRDEHLEEETRNGLRNSFLFKMYLLRRELAKINTQILRYIVLGFLCLWISAILSKRLGADTLVSLIIDALIIGGWVFLWEAVSLFFFTNREIYHRYRLYKRLYDSPIVFRETAKTT